MAVRHHPLVATRKQPAAARLVRRGETCTDRRRRASRSGGATGGV